MKLYSYIVKHDTGFAPNPFHGYCTLACCKPVIRRTAEEGDWVVGLTPKEDSNRIVYLMRVDEEPISYAEYWQDKRFKAKRPRYNDGVISKCGDNIYEPQGSGYRQLQSAHSNGELENPKMKARDLRGKRILISKTFAYFGSKPRELPLELSALSVGRGHRSRFSDEVKGAFLRFTRKVKFGVHAAPRRWPETDMSWNNVGGGCMDRTK